MGEFKKAPPFTQITADREDLYGLDAEGRVWIYFTQPQLWSRITNRQDKNDPGERT